MHSDHKESGPNRENISLLAVVFRMQGKPSQLSLNLRTIIKSCLSVILILGSSLLSKLSFLSPHELFCFVNINFVIPYFRGIINLRAYILSPFNLRIVFSLEKLITFNFGHSNCETKIGNNELAFTVDQKIFWLDVTVYDTMRVEISHTGKHLVENIPGHWFSEGSIIVLYETVQLTKLGKLHYIVAKVILLFSHLHDAFLFSRLGHSIKC